MLAKVLLLTRNIMRYCFDYIRQRKYAVARETGLDCIVENGKEIRFRTRNNNISHIGKVGCFFPITVTQYSSIETLFGVHVT